MFLQLLQSPSNDFGAGMVVPLRSAVSSLQSTIDVRQKSDSGVGSEVDFTSKGSNSNIDPVLVERS